MAKALVGEFRLWERKSDGFREPKLELDFWIDNETFASDQRVNDLISRCETVLV